MMQEFSQNLTKKIMRRVYAVWFLKRLAPVMFLEMPFLAVIALNEAAREFFWASIIENFAVSLGGGISNTLNFIGLAFLNAPVLPLAIIVFSAGLFAVLSYRIFRNLKSLTLVRI